MKCPNCNNSAKLTDIFCPSCGFQLIQEDLTKGRIIVESNVKGLTVLINSTPTKYSAPCEIDLAEGRYTVQLSDEEYHSEKEILDITRNKDIRVNFKCTKWARLKINNSNRNIRFSVNNNPVINNAWNKLTPGTYSLRSNIRFQSDLKLDLHEGEDKEFREDELIKRVDLTLIGLDRKFSVTCANQDLNSFEKYDFENTGNKNGPESAARKIPLYYGDSFVTIKYRKIKRKFRITIKDDEPADLELKETFSSALRKKRLKTLTGFVLIFLLGTFIFFRFFDGRNTLNYWRTFLFFDSEDLGGYGKDFYVTKKLNGWNRIGLLKYYDKIYFSEAKLITNPLSKENPGYKYVTFLGNEEKDNTNLDFRMFDGENLFRFKDDSLGSKYLIIKSMNRFRTMHYLRKQEDNDAISSTRTENGFYDLRNNKDHFQIKIPKGFELYRKSISETSNEAIYIFLTSDRRSSLKVMAEETQFAGNFSDKYDRAQRNYKVTYKVFNDRMFVVSGYIEYLNLETIFYQKTIYSKRYHSYLTFRIEYPASESDAYNKIVNILFSSLKQLD